MIQVTFNGVQKYYLFPEKWDELTQEQFLSFINILSNSDSIEKSKLQIAQRFLNAPNRVFYNLSSLLKFKNTAQMELELKWMAVQFQEDLLPYLEFLFQPDPFFCNPIKEFVVGKKIYYGPKNGFEDVTIGEIEEADQAYQMYTTEKDIKWLIRLAAVLFREKKVVLFRKIDERLPFDIDAIDKSIENLSKLDETTLLAIKFVYERILSWYAAHPVYKELFLKSADSTPDIKGWSRIIRALAGEKLGTVETVRKMKLYDALDQMFLASKEIEEQTQNKQE